MFDIAVALRKPENALQARTLQVTTKMGSAHTSQHATASHACLLPMKKLFLTTIMKPFEVIINKFFCLCPPVDLHWCFEISILAFISNWDKKSVMN